MSPLLLMATIAATQPVPVTFVDDARQACTLTVSEHPIPGIRVEPLAIDETGFEQVRVTDEHSGGWMIVLFDPASKAAALGAAPCLGAQLRLLSAELGRTSPGQWSSAVFATVAPSDAPTDGITRWHVPTEPGGILGVEGRKMVVLTMPHEQVHRDQRRAGAQLPRWFGEGHAEWVSRPIQQLIAPEMADAERQQKTAELDGYEAEPRLRDWGGLKIRREALRRQVSPDEQARMDADPRYFPAMDARSFKFEPEDLVNEDGDLRLTGIRYQAAWSVFNQLEASTGREQVRRWIDGIVSTTGQVSTTAIIERSKSELQVDLQSLLE